MESLLASSSSTGAQRRSYLAVSISERQAVTNKSLSLSSMLSFNRKEWILFFRKGESGDLRTTSCNAQIVNLNENAGFQSVTNTIYVHGKHRQRTHILWSRFP